MSFGEEGGEGDGDGTALGMIGKRRRECGGEGRVRRVRRWLRWD
jgi:hypothetical protein